MLHRGLVCSILLFCAWTGSLILPGRGPSSTAEVNADPGPVEQSREGLRFRLSEGAEQGGVRAPIKAAQSDPLPPGEGQALLERLRPIKAEAGDEQNFAFRDRSLPPPLTGATIADPFPARPNGDIPDGSSGGPLEVVRFGPEGDVPIAPHLTVTFSQPMVSVTSAEELAARDVPVKLSPQPEGKWRWISTKTLLFEPEGRFPMAATYSVQIPAGLKSALGEALQSTKRWSFTTPAPQIKMSYPGGGPHRRDAIMFLEFDQQVDTSRIIRKIHVRSGGYEIRTRLATRQEVDSDETIHQLVKSAVDGRWLALRAVSGMFSETRQALPAGSTVTVSIDAGTPSAEGPRVTGSPQTFSFDTYGPLIVADHHCASGQCTAMEPWFISFSNPLNGDSFRPSQVRVEPELSRMQVFAGPSAIWITGLIRGHTNYKVTLDRSIADEFGQTLGQDTSLTFDVQSADPGLSAPKQNLVVLDPASPARYSVFSTNHKNLKVSLYAVVPDDWSRYLTYARWHEGYTGEDTHAEAPPGRLVMSNVIAVDAEPDQMAETAIDLLPAFNDGLGQVVVVVEPVGDVDEKKRRSNRGIVAWVQATRIGLDAFVDRSNLTAWATSLTDGQPIDGVEVSLQSSSPRVRTGDDGIAQLTLPSGKRKEHGLLVARRGDDVAILPEDSNTYWGRSESEWVKQRVADSLRWYVFDDRGMYKPGEEVRVKGWVRRLGEGKDGDIGPLAGLARQISYTVKDSRGREVARGAAFTDALGGFDTRFKLPDAMNLGEATIELKAVDASRVVDDPTYSHEFEVQEFRRPEFEVSAKAADGPVMIGGHADVAVKATYYSGGGLPNAEVNWRVTATPGYFTPPNRGDFTFGQWIPWWTPSRDYATPQVQAFEGVTDSSGKHHLRVDLDSIRPARPMSVVSEATVKDLNRQAWTASATFLVHPASLYVGLRSSRTFVQEDEPLIVESIITDLDGKAVAGRVVRMREVRIESSFSNGLWRETEKDPQNNSVVSSADAASCKFQPKQGGTYRITATIVDDQGRENQSTLTMWVAGGRRQTKNNVEQDEVQLIPDRKDYQPGETAEILLQAPFFPAAGLLTLRRSGIVHTERFTMTGPSRTLKIPIVEGYTPNVQVQVDLNGTADRAVDPGSGLLGDDATRMRSSSSKRPAYATGSLNLNVPPHARRLAVKATPRAAAVEPGAETTVDVQLQDATGNPVGGGECAVVVVDEAILALSDYKLVDPIEVFYSRREPDTEDYHSRRDVLLADQMKPPVPSLGGGGRGASAYADEFTAPKALASAPEFLGRRGRGEPVNMLRGTALSAAIITSEGGRNTQFDQLLKLQKQIRMRENFNALALFAATVPTDESGRASVKLKLPDSLTRYRIMAVAVAGGKQFGYGESTITARQPLMVRPSPPRFLNFGDRFELPILIQNQTDSPMEVKVAVRASNAELTEAPGRGVTVPANDRVEVRIPAATLRPGKARFQIAATSGQWSDAAEVELPVWSPATTEAFATYGEIDDGAVGQALEAPSDAVSGFGGLELTTSSTQLQSLTDAVLYLVSYPYECSEQLASRVLAIAALRDVLAAFHAKGLPPAGDLTAAVARDITRLQALQNADAGFAFWRRGDQSWPYLSIHVAHALQRAKQKGFAVPAQMLNRSNEYLRNIDQHIPGDYGPDARRALECYALYVRNLMGDKDPARARQIVAEAAVDSFSMESLGWLLTVVSGDPDSATVVSAIRKRLTDSVEETAATAHFTTSYADGDHLLLASDRRADGVVLEALIGDQPASDLIPKIVRGLLAHRTEGRWGNTQENAFILLALDRYFRTYERVSPNFIARAWLGNASAGAQRFAGRSTGSREVTIPMGYLVGFAAAQNLVLSKTGQGRLYYRLGLQYAPASLTVPAADYGFTVARQYEAVDDPADVRRNSDGTWHIKAGARVRVRLTMVAPARRYHVALVDPIPAGLEPVNPELAVTGRVPPERGDEESSEPWRDREESGPRVWYGPWRSGVWYEHENLRDERVEAFASLLAEGVYKYSYVARATTPGVFRAAPPKAEEMYHPETFGRGLSDRVVVE